MDREIVIRIPEETYNQIVEESKLSPRYLDYFERRVAEGTPLPKGHGRLGDLSKIYVELNEAQIEGTEEYKGLGEAKQIVCNAPTIIEAEKGAEK